MGGAAPASGVKTAPHSLGSSHVPCSGVPAALQALVCGWHACAAAALHEQQVGTRIVAGGKHLLHLLRPCLHDRSTTSSSSGYQQQARPSQRSSSMMLSTPETTRRRRPTTAPRPAAAVTGQRIQTTPAATPVTRWVALQAPRQCIVYSRRSLSLYPASWSLMSHNFTLVLSPSLSSNALVANPCQPSPALPHSSHPPAILLPPPPTPPCCCVHPHVHTPRCGRHTSARAGSCPTWWMWSSAATTITSNPSRIRRERAATCGAACWWVAAAVEAAVRVAPWRLSS